MSLPTIPQEYGGIFQVTIWGILGLIGAGIKVGTELGKGTRLNFWQISSTFLAGGAFASVSTQTIVDMCGVKYAGISGIVALVLGLIGIGLAKNAIEGNIPIINKIFGNIGSQK